MTTNSDHHGLSDYTTANTGKPTPAHGKRKYARKPHAIFATTGYAAPAKQYPHGGNSVEYPAIRPKGARKLLRSTGWRVSDKTAQSTAKAQAAFTAQVLELMAEQDLSLADIAARMGCKKQNVHQALNAVRRFGMNLVTMHAFADALGMELVVELKPKRLMAWPTNH